MKTIITLIFFSFFALTAIAQKTNEPDKKKY